MISLKLNRFKMKYVAPSLIILIMLFLLGRNYRYEYLFGVDLPLLYVDSYSSFFDGIDGQSGVLILRVPSDSFYRECSKDPAYKYEKLSSSDVFLLASRLEVFLIDKDAIYCKRFLIERRQDFNLINRRVYVNENFLILLFN